MTAKVKVIKTENKDVSELFSQMLGAGGSVNVNICYPKYTNMKLCVGRLIKVFELLRDSPMFKRWTGFESSIAEISTFIEQSKAQSDKLFLIDFGSVDHNLNLLDDEQKKNFGIAYEEVKKDPLVATFVTICDNLIIYRKYIQDVEKLDFHFISTMPGVEFTPFPFTHLNLKELINDILTDTNDSASRQVPVTSKSNSMLYMLLLLLNKIYTLSYNLYKTYSSPDIDVDEFVNVVMENLTQVRKHIPRCDKAFNKIAESVKLLKSNFGTYYKDFVQTKNQTIIMENFVLDVAKNTHADADTTRQFREIIKYYRKIAASQIKNPQLKMLFDKVNENFRELEKHQNISKMEKEGSDDDDNDSDSDTDDASTPEDPKAAEARRLLSELVVDDSPKK